MSNTVVIPEEVILVLAHDVLNGAFGDGEDRRVRLGDLYIPVQQKVNEILNRQRVWFTPDESHKIELLWGDDKARCRKCKAHTKVDLQQPCP